MITVSLGFPSTTPRVMSRFWEAFAAPWTIYVAGSLVQPTAWQAWLPSWGSVQSPLLGLFASSSPQRPALDLFFMGPW